MTDHDMRVAARDREYSDDVFGKPFTAKLQPNAERTEKERRTDWEKQQLLKITCPECGMVGHDDDDEQLHWNDCPSL